MGMKLAIVQKNDNGKADKIDYFRNNSKGIGDFIILLNEQFIKNNINVRIGKFED